MIFDVLIVRGEITKEKFASDLSKLNRNSQVLLSIFYCAGFPKEVFDKALSKHSNSRPQSATVARSGSRASDCVICQSPDAWRSNVDKQKNEGLPPISTQKESEVADGTEKKTDEDPVRYLIEFPLVSNIEMHSKFNF